MAQVMDEAVSSAAYHRRAMRTDAAGDFENAEALYRSLLEIRPLDVVIHYQLGNMLARQGKFPQARDQYRKALDVDLRHAPTLVAFGNMLNYQGKFDEAVRQYRNALDVRPEDTVTRNNLANVLAKKGELEQARAHYQKSLEYEPGNFDAHHNLGQVLARQGKIEQAIAHYRSALRSKQNVGLVQQLSVCVFDRTVSVLLRPAAGYDPAPFDAGRLDRVDPGEFPDSVDRGGHQHTAVQAGTAWTEALQAVDGRQAG